jgi:hypothetical protein
MNIEKIQKLIADAFEKSNTSKKQSKLKAVK